MKKWMVIAACVLVGLFILGVLKDAVIKVGVETGVQVVTGLKMKIGSFGVGLMNTLVDIKNLRIMNPAGFKDKNMLNMSEIYVDYDLPAIFGGKVHLTEARINMQEFMVVKNEKGELNLNSLKMVQAQKTGGKPQEKSAGKLPDIQIDKLTLKIGKVIYKDYSKGGEPSVTEFNINLNEEYKNITNPYTLASLIVVKAMMSTPIAGLANFDMRGMQGSVSETMAGAQKVALETTKKAQEAAQKAAKAASEATKNATGALSDVLKNPFGGGN
jgi:hypothetical protein